MTLGTAACQRPGDLALEQLVNGVERLIELVGRRDRGELDEAGMLAALHAWQRSEGAEIARVSSEAARSMAPPHRRALAERWRHASERLLARLATDPKERVGVP
jgi:hypothetical protein